MVHITKVDFPQGGRLFLLGEGLSSLKTLLNEKDDQRGTSIDFSYE